MAITSKAHHNAILVFIVVFAAYGLYVMSQFKPHKFTAADPGWQVTTVMSLVEDGDLDLRNQLSSDSEQAQDQTSQGAHGEWYPLHEYLMPIATIPFYLAFGVIGCLFFNLLISCAVIVVCYYIAEHYTEPLTALIATLLVAATSHFLHYSYSYSVDVFGVLLIALCYLALIKERYTFAGIFMGIAVIARLQNVFLLPAFLLYPLLSRATSAQSTQNSCVIATVKFLLGGIPFVFILGISNYLMFGNALETSYDHWQRFQDGTLTIVSQRSIFTVPLWDGLKRHLFSQTEGFLIGSPLFFIGMLVGFIPLLKNHFRSAVVLLASAILLLVCYSKYSAAFPGFGNRYLMPLTVFSTVLVALPLKRILRRNNSHKQPA